MCCIIKNFQALLLICCCLIAQAETPVGAAEADVPGSACLLCTEYRPNPCTTCSPAVVAYRIFSPYTDPRVPYPGAPKTVCIPCDCGNRIIDEGEDCDDGNNVGFDGCSGDCKKEFCGDGITQTLNYDRIAEQCDFGSGNANTPDTCRTNCQLPKCGDNIIDTGLGEYCDGTSLPAAARPANIPQLAWDNRSCGAPGTEYACKVKLPSYCGDGIANGVEQCDGTSFAAGLVKPANVPQSVWNAKTCNAVGTLNECKYKLPSFCGDGIANGEEQCDGTSFYPELEKPVDVPQSVWDAKTCNAVGTPNQCKYKLGNFCGDGILGAGEQCDGTLFDPALVKPANVPLAVWNAKLCNAKGTPNECKYKLGNYCGDGVASGTEQCDGTSFDPTLVKPANVPQAAWDAKTCSPADGVNACKFVLPGYCGDGVANGTEQCDGTSFAAGLVKPANIPQSAWDAKTCNAKGTANECKYTVGAYCGDALLAAGEQCDGALFDTTLVKPANVPQSAWEAKTCGTVGANACKYILPGYCGDNIANGTEQCDGTSFAAGLIKPIEIPQSAWDAKTCNAKGTPNECKFTVGAYCGDGLLAAGEQCDGTLFSPALIKPANVPQSVWDAKTCNPKGTPHQCTYVLGDYCGDGVTCNGEECDDGNQIDDDACSNTCVGKCKYYRFTGDVFEWEGAWQPDDADMDEKEWAGHKVFEGADVSKLSCLSKIWLDIGNTEMKLGGDYLDDTVYCNFANWVAGNGNLLLNGGLDLWRNGQCQALTHYNTTDMTGNFGTAYLDENCNVIKTPVTEKDICGEIKVRALSSPISLLLDKETDINTNWAVVKFKLNPAKDAEWLVWKSNAETPLLVYDPEGTGKVEDGRQLFGNFTFGGKEGLSKVSIQSNSNEWIWKNGYEALATLDGNRDGEVSGKEMSSISLWFDKNQNAVADKGEVVRASDYGLTKLNVKADYQDDRGDVYAVNGFELNKAGTTVKGSTVDWFTKSYNSFQDTVGALKSVSKTFKEETENFLEANKTSDIAGAYLWTPSEKLNGIKPAGLLLITEKKGKISGFSLVEEKFRPNADKVGSRIIKLPITGNVISSENGVTKFKFTVSDKKGVNTESLVELSNGKLTGKSMYTTEVKNKTTVVKYEWTAVKATPPKK